jgi:hypothetical protein
MIGPAYGRRHPNRVLSLGLYNDLRCESGILSQEHRLVWTKRDHDVPDDESFTVKGGMLAITCRE